ncbi:MAG: hypothetical protein Q9160_000152 [Pyrenula sp. 1 TL-2023]
MESGSLLQSFLGALQASLAVLLTIFYGVVAAQFDLLDAQSAKKVSKICVRLFLPALLITNVGSELHADTVTRYIPILPTKFLKLPPWVTPAICFNNTTALPLLLIESLSTTGLLSRLMVDPNDDAGSAVTRAKSYFLVNAIIGNCLTFAIGPRLLDAENAPEKKEEEGTKPGVDDERVNGHANGDVEQGNEGQPQNEEATEQTSLLPDHIVRPAHHIAGKAEQRGQTYFSSLSPRTQGILQFVFDFFNAPLLGAIIGAVLGLASPLHKAFFGDPQSASATTGIFTAWLTSSLQKIGGLFASLQIVVVGVSLASSLRKAKRGEESGPIPWLPSLFVLLVRLVIWPVLSVAIIWGFATKTGLLGSDPILWFAMMLMPTGPPAMKLVAMADVNGLDESEKMSIAKLLTVGTSAFYSWQHANVSLLDFLRRLAIDMFCSRCKSESK